MTPYYDCSGLKTIQKGAGRWTMSFLTPEDYSTNVLMPQPLSQDTPQLQKPHLAYSLPQETAFLPRLKLAHAHPRTARTSTQPTSCLVFPTGGWFSGSRATMKSILRSPLFGVCAGLALATALVASTYLVSRTWLSISSANVITVTGAA
jgi:hypothetical protein